MHNFTSTQPVGTTQHPKGVVPVTNEQSISQKLPVRVSNLLDVLAGIVNRNKSESNDPKQAPKEDAK